MTGPNRQVNQATLNLIKHFEGCKLIAYQDVAGVWTIGYGSTTGVKPGMVITQEQAEARLIKDLSIVESVIPSMVRCELTDNEFGALCSFTYNVGIHHLAQSTLLKIVNGGDKKDVADEFLKWDIAGGRIVEGLKLRREAERTLFLS